MSIFKAIMAFGLFAVVAACAQQEEAVMIEDPIVEEDTMTKY